MSTTSKTSEGFRNWLRQLRAEAGLSAEELAQATGADARTVKRWFSETNPHDPSALALLRLLDALGVRLQPSSPGEGPRAVNTEIQALREEMLNQLGAQRESMFKLAVYPFGEGVPGLLTARELEVLGWLAEGKSYEQVLEFVRFEAEDADELKDMAREGIARLIDRSKDKETSGSEWIHWEVEGTAARRHDELIARFDQLVESIRSLVQAGDPERSRRELEDTAARRHEELASKLEQLAEAIRGQTLRLGRD